MPQALVPAVAGWLASVGASTAFVVAASGFIASALVYGAAALAYYSVSAAFSPAKPTPPKPEDGKYNLKQSVPPRVFVLGENKKAGDYAFLEERAGVAHHVMVAAAHSIKGFKQHYLHDEAVTLTGSVVTTPAHFNLNGSPHVQIQTRTGNAASTAYADIVSTFPEIWTVDHRGDGLASVYMKVASTPAENLQEVYPNQMPQHSAVIEGHDQLIDPRTGLPGYSTNIALFRFWHLTHPVGGKLRLEDMYLPEWSRAADVCDEMVLNRGGLSEHRYHGGLWFRANNDPVQIGLLLDQAGELVIYERPDGKIGVHAGEFVEPDVRLTGNDLLSVSYDANKRKSANVIAVRGRYTDPLKGFNTADAAIYGVPYPTDDERTKTVDNQTVQSHNHMARMQKLAYIRANAPRVKLVAHFEPARNVPYRRFIRVNFPPKLSESMVEITGRPTLSLRNLTYSFDGIVVPEDLYSFVAATEEGAPGANVIPIEREDVPVPEGFDVTIEDDTVGGGVAYYGLAVWDTLPNDAFTYEMEWQATSGGVAQQVTSMAGAGSVRSAYLADDVEVRFRLRRWSIGTSSDWTDYVIRTP